MRDDDRHRHEEIRLREAERRVTLANRNATVSKLVQIIYFLAGALGMLLLLRMILRLFGANPDNTFAQFIYNLSEPFYAPVANLFGTPKFGNSQVFEINALVAIAAYAILGWLVGRLVWLIGSRTE